MLENLNIAQIGDPILRKKTRELSIEEIQSSDTKNIILKMIKTMRKYNGAGLAANQIFEPLRVCIIEILENPPRFKQNL